MGVLVYLPRRFHLLSVSLICVSGVDALGFLPFLRGRIQLVAASGLGNFRQPLRVRLIAAG